jgi:AcrR family transcriptional regulator
MMASSTQARQDAGDVGRGPGKDPAAGQRRRPGRPRNAAYDKSILGAALDMLVEKGYKGLTIDGVAARAGVGRPTIYRRWPSKAALAIAALEEAVPQAVTPDSSTGSLRDDLRAFQQDRVARMNLAVTRPVIAGLVSDSVADPALAAAFRAWYRRHQEAVVAALQRAIDRGELPPGVDFELINDLLLGPLFTRSVVRGEHLEPRHGDDTVEVVLAALCGGTRP